MAYEVTAQQYQDEWITSFQRGETYLKDCVTKETVTQGNSAAVFPIAGVSSGMVSRGANGLIPTRGATDRQVTFTLKERHTLENQTNFNVFTSQGAKLRQVMQTRSRMDAYREIDDEIIATLQTATNEFRSGAAQSITYGMVTDAVSDLWELDAGMGVCFVWTPKSWAKLFKIKEFASADYVDSKPIMGDAMRPRVWNNATHFMHTGLPGKGTSTAKNYAFAKAAIGHCVSPEGIDVDADFNREQAYSWDRATIYHTAGVLQQEGLIEITTDDTEVIA